MLARNVRALHTGDRSVESAVRVRVKLHAFTFVVSLLLSKCLICCGVLGAEIGWCVGDRRPVAVTDTRRV